MSIHLSAGAQECGFGTLKAPQRFLMEKTTLQPLTPSHTSIPDVQTLPDTLTAAAGTLVYWTRSWAGSWKTEKLYWVDAENIKYQVNRVDTNYRQHAWYGFDWAQIAPVRTNQAYRRVKPLLKATNVLVLAPMNEGTTDYIATLTQGNYYPQTVLTGLPQFAEWINRATRRRKIGQSPTTVKWFSGMHQRVELTPGKGTCAITQPHFYDRQAEFERSVRSGAQSERLYSLKKIGAPGHTDIAENVALRERLKALEVTANGEQYLSVKYIGTYDLDNDGVPEQLYRITGYESHDYAVFTYRATNQAGDQWELIYRGGGYGGTE